MLEQHAGTATVLVFLLAGLMHLLIIRPTLHKVMDKQAVNHRLKEWVK